MYNLYIPHIIESKTKTIFVQTGITDHQRMDRGPTKDPWTPGWGPLEKKDWSPLLASAVLRKAAMTPNSMSVFWTKKLYSACLWSCKGNDRTKCVGCTNPLICQVFYCLCLILLSLSLYILLSLPRERLPVSLQPPACLPPPLSVVQSQRKPKKHILQ